MQSNDNARGAGRCMSAPGVAKPELAHQSVVDLASLGAIAHQTAAVAPTNDKAAGANSGDVRTKQTDNLDCANADAKRKCRATLAAQLAMRGFQLLETDNGTFIVCRWNLSRMLADLDQVAAFARRVGATR